ncbi:large ribosomal subunit protein bL9m-like [Lineus longissimus]|uniref:large ribosomal subunit protein bL9m-like n=1 Tax=Lineus longissimus TaxID=88925 RepID=UPI002B4F6FC9
MFSKRLSHLSRSLAKGCAKVLSEQPNRTTVVVKRKWPAKLGNGDEFARLKTRNFIYEVVENRAQAKHPDVRVILADNVEGFGAEGDVIDVRANIARTWLLPSKVAVYPSPENLEKYERIKKERGDTGPRHTAYAMGTIRALRDMELVIPMNRNADWSLTKTHVRVAFRKMGIEVPDDCITMPEEDISHDVSGEDFTVGVTVNGIETVPVSTKIVYWELDELGNLPDIPQIQVKKDRRWSAKDIITKS